MLFLLNNILNAQTTSVGNENFISYKQLYKIIAYITYKELSDSTNIQKSLPPIILEPTEGEYEEGIYYREFLPASDNPGAEIYESYRKEKMTYEELTEDVAICYLDNNPLYVKNEFERRRFIINFKKEIDQYIRSFDQDSLNIILNVNIDEYNFYSNFFQIKNEEPEIINYINDNNWRKLRNSESLIGMFKIPIKNKLASFYGLNKFTIAIICKQPWNKIIMSKKNAEIFLTKYEKLRPEYKNQFDKSRRRAIMNIKTKINMIENYEDEMYIIEANIMNAYLYTTKKEIQSQNYFHVENY